MILILFIAQTLGNYLENYSPLPSTTVCAKYSCATSKIKKPFANSCISAFSASQYYLWTCPSESTTNFCNTTSQACQVPKASVSLSYAGEPCVLSSDCYLSSCVNKICRGSSINKSCISHDQCDFGLRCSSVNSTCQPQLAVGSKGCRSYLDCVNWATCNLTYSSTQGTCIEYSSLPNGQYVTDCIGSFSYMCSSGYCFKKYNFMQAGVCAVAPVSISPLPTLCSVSTDCKGIVNGNNVTSECVCGYNGLGNSYCTPFIGDMPGVIMLKSWNLALKKTVGCNTARRAADGCMKMLGLLKNTTQAALGYYNYPLYVGNDACVQFVYNNDYYLEGSELFQVVTVLVLLNFF